MSTKRLSLHLALCVVAAQAAVAPTAAPAAQVEVTCEACLVVDEAGRVLFARNESVGLPNASTTKMVTALLVRERADLAAAVQISPEAAAVGGGGLDLDPGGGYDVEELLLALLLTSSNEAAVALAEHVSGSEEAFVDLMNRTARSSGWTGTSFVTSHGLDRPGHQSSAEDLASIARALLGDRVLAEMVALSSTTIVGPEGSVRLENRNLLLEGYEGAIGVKTGFTALAGNVLVSAARRSGRTLIAVAMDSVDATADSVELLDHGFALLRRAVLVRKGAVHGGLVFDTAGSTAVVASRSRRGLAPAGGATIVFVPHSGITLPVAAGEPVGVLKVTDRRGRRLASVAAVAQRSVTPDEPSLAERAFSGLLRRVASLLGAG